MTQKDENLVNYALLGSKIQILRNSWTFLHDRTVARSQLLETLFKFSFYLICPVWYIRPVSKEKRRTCVKMLFQGKIYIYIFFKCVFLKQHLWLNYICVFWLFQMLHLGTPTNNRHGFCKTKNKGWLFRNSVSDWADGFYQYWPINDIYKKNYCLGYLEGAKDFT